MLAGLNFSDNRLSTWWPADSSTSKSWDGYTVATPVPPDPPVGGPWTYPTYPYDGITVYLEGSTLVTIERGPELGDAQLQSFAAKTRKTRGQDLKIVKDTNWPEFERLSLTFRGLSQSKTEEIRTFMKANLGHHINYIDHHGRIWPCIVLTPFNNTAIEGRGDSYNLSFELQGII